MATTKKATKKVSLKEIEHTRRGWKLDRAFISNQPHEVEYVQTIFFQRNKGSFASQKSEIPFRHPSSRTIKILIKGFNNSRFNVYKELKNLGWIRVMKNKNKKS